jgi:hypothetical protein
MGKRMLIKLIYPCLITIIYAQLTSRRCDAEARKVFKSPYKEQS